MQYSITLLVAQSCLTHCDPTDCIAHKVPLSMDFSMQEYWSGWTFPSPGDLPHTGIEPRTIALQADALPSEPPGKLQRACRMMIILTPLLLSLAG